MKFTAPYMLFLLWTINPSSSPLVQAQSLTNSSFEYRVEPVLGPRTRGRSPFIPPPRELPEHWSSVFRTEEEELLLKPHTPPPGERNKHARWLVAASRLIVPGTSYQVAVQNIRTGTDQPLPLTMRAALTLDGRQISAGKVLLQPGELDKILLEVPPTESPGKWKLRVEGYEGVKGGRIFQQHANLTFSPSFLTILIQPSRPVYNAGQTVMFRAILLTRDLKPYDEPVDIFVLDPRGKVMKRWPSRQTGHGVVTLSFALPAYPVLGKWRLRVQALAQIEDKSFIVEQYFKPRFEVFVRLPHTVKSSAEYLEGVVVANMTNWRHVYGNCSVKLQISVHDKNTRPSDYQTVYEEFLYDFRGVYPLRLSVNPLLETLMPSEGKDLSLRVVADVGDAFGWRIIRGWAVARVVQEKAHLKILGDQPLVFRPGMPITLHVFASYSDQHPFDEDELESAELTVTLSTSGASNKVDSIKVYGQDLIEQEGVAEFTFDISEFTDSLKVDASFISSSGLMASDTLVGIKHHSPRQYYIQVETSTPEGLPGEFLVLHVRNNFRTEYINYIIVGEGVVLYSDREPVVDPNIPSITTFSIPASTQMAPVVRVLVWAPSEDGHLVTHAIAIPVSPLGRHECAVRWNEHKDHSGGSTEMKMLGEAGSFYGISSIWEETNFMDAGHDLDHARVLHHMMGLGEDARLSKEAIQETLYRGKETTNHNHLVKEDYTYAEFPLPHIRRAASRSRDGAGAQVRFFPTSMAGPDPASTFVFSQLVLLTDAGVYYHNVKATDAGECDSHTLPCLTGGCYLPSSRCDGTPDCSDRSDEAGCPIDVDPLREYRLYRMSRIDRFYDPVDGDWAWRDVREEGGEIQVFPIPKRPQTWVLNIFAVGPTLGLGLLQKKITFDSAGPFTLKLEAPKVARMWEQVGLRVCVFNFHHTIIAALITLPQSDLYRTVIVKENGDTDSYNPMTTSGEFQHLVWLQPGEYRDVSIPIVFTGLGEVEVVVTGSTQMQIDSDAAIISVQAEGVTIGKHTSILLDLKNRALVYEFLDITLDESPIIPYSLKRRYIYSTPSGHISITGDVVGPSFPEIPVGTESLLGVELMGAEADAYNFAANLWSLHYLRLTNQLTQETAYKVLDAVGVQYAALARYQNPDGGFSMFPGDEPSVWLTSWILRTLMVAAFQDWENQLYIDPTLLAEATRWLLSHQTPEGAFRETGHYDNPLNPHVKPNSLLSWTPDRTRNITLTAHALLALVQTLPTLQSTLRSKANSATTSAIRYLERELQSLTDPYDIAVVAWALTKADAAGADLAFERLDIKKRENGNRIYWSREPVGFNPLVYEDSQRPFVQPKDDQKWDSHAVETTAYALLVYVERESLGLIQENIVRFLAVMRELDGGLISTLDSAVALEALVAYSYRARIRDITDLKVNIEFSAQPNKSIDLHLTNDGELASFRSFDLDAIYGHISVVGHGSGQALVQLDYSYAVDQPDEVDFPPVEAFDLEIRAVYSGRNNSHIAFNACQRWTNTDPTETSGLTITEVHLPSGYFIVQDHLIELVESRTVPNLRWALRTDTQVKFFFNRITSNWTCVSYEVERWHAVSNHSRYNRAMIYSHYQPERFNMTVFEVYPLYDLDICEVCGSFQCPYCPFYSGSLSTMTLQYTTLYLLLLPALCSALFAHTVLPALHYRGIATYSVGVS